MKIFFFLLLMQFTFVHTIDLFQEASVKNLFEEQNAQRDSHRIKKKLKYQENGKFSIEFIQIVMAAAPQRLKAFIKHANNPNSDPDLRPVRILLHGRSGTGKTTLARIFAQMTDRKCIFIDAPNLGDKYVDSISSNLQEKIFSQIDGPAIVVLDEVDVLLQESKSDVDPKKNVSKQTWTILDRLATDYPHVTVIGTTNSIKGWPESIKSRFSRHTIEVPLPDVALNHSILSFYLEGKPHKLDDKFLLNFTNNCKELSARELEELVLEAFFQASLRENDTKINAEDMQKALELLKATKEAMNTEAQSGSGIGFWGAYNAVKVTYNLGTSISCWWKSVGCELPRMP